MIDIKFRNSTDVTSFQSCDNSLENDAMISHDGSERNEVKKKRISIVYQVKKEAISDEEEKPAPSSDFIEASPIEQVGILEYEVGVLSTELCLEIVKHS